MAGHANFLIDEHGERGPNGVDQPGDAGPPAGSIDVATAATRARYAQRVCYRQHPGMQLTAPCGDQRSSLTTSFIGLLVTSTILASANGRVVDFNFLVHHTPSTVVVKTKWIFGRSGFPMRLANMGPIKDVVRYQHVLALNFINVLHARFGDDLVDWHGIFRSETLPK
jgi:hypothetical protein